MVTKFLVYYDLFYILYMVSSYRSNGNIAQPYLNDCYCEIDYLFQHKFLFKMAGDSFPANLHLPSVIHSLSPFI